MFACHYLAAAVITTVFAVIIDEEEEDAERASLLDPPNYIKSANKRRVLRDE